MIAIYIIVKDAHGGSSGYSCGGRMKHKLSVRWTNEPRKIQPECRCGDDEENIESSDYLTDPTSPDYFARSLSVPTLRFLLRNQFPKDRFNESMFKAVEEFINWVEENTGGQK